MGWSLGENDADQSSCRSIGADGGSAVALHALVGAHSDTVAPSPRFDRKLDGAVKGIIRYDIYLDGYFVGSRSEHARCHGYLDELMHSPSESDRATATNHELRERVAQR